MLKELAEKIEELVNGQVEPELETISGVDYIKTAKGYDRLRKPKADSINVNSLSGLTEMVKVVIENEVLGIPTLVVNVDVNDIIVSTSHNIAGEIDQIIRAYPLIPDLGFGRRQSVEELIIKLSTAFTETENTTKFINSISSLRIVEDVEFNDDGIGQTITAKKGAQLNQKYTIQPIVKLKPIRSYAEIEQVESKFLFRVDRSGEVILYEADGGQWRYDVQKRIVKYLNGSLKELINDGKVKIIG